MKLAVRRVVYEEFDGDRNDVVTLAEAAERLGITVQGVASAINRGRLTEVVDLEAVKARQNVRFVVGAEIA